MAFGETVHKGTMAPLEGLYEKSCDVWGVLSSVQGIAVSGAGLGGLGSYVIQYATMDASSGE